MPASSVRPVLATAAAPREGRRTAEGAPTALSTFHATGRQVGLPPYLIRSNASAATCRTQRFYEHLMEPRFDKLDIEAA